MRSELALYGSLECIREQRNYITNETNLAPFRLSCIRHVWSSYNLARVATLQAANSQRKCPFFFPYNSGYSPNEHRELQREARTQKVLIVGMLLAALIGAAAAIVAQFIVR